jgi:hypothetical protein
MGIPRQNLGKELFASNFCGNENPQLCWDSSINVLERAFIALANTQYTHTAPLLLYWCQRR